MALFTTGKKIDRAQFNKNRITKGLNCQVVKSRYGSVVFSSDTDSSMPDSYFLFYFTMPEF